MELHTGSAAVLPNRVNSKISFRVVTHSNLERLWQLNNVAEAQPRSFFIQIGDDARHATVRAQDRFGWLCGLRAWYTASVDEHLSPPRCCPPRDVQAAPNDWPTTGRII